MKIRFPTPIHFWWRGSGPLAAGRTALIFLVVCLSPWTARAAANGVTFNGLEVHPTRILAQYKPSGPMKASAVALRSLGSQAGRQYDLVPGLVVLDDLAGVSAGLADAQARQNRLVSRLEALKQSGLFEFVEPDYLVRADRRPTDTAFDVGLLWGLWNFGQSGGKPGADISATNAWDLTRGSTNVIVAVIDTGIRYTHQDLMSQMWRNSGEIPDNGLDDDGNGFVDDVHGINAINGSGDPLDDNDHGTHCSGTIGAQANGGGPMVGVTWLVRLMGCKFLSASGSGYTSDAITCINYAVAKGARILNNSWGGGGYSLALYDAINAARLKGVLFVAAAGNSAENNDLYPHYPSSYPLDNIVSVAAVDRDDQLAYFSCYGANSVDLGAPGVSIYSCTAGSDTEYQYFDGTSMATPHVSGVAALIWSLFPNASLDEVRQRLLMGTVPIAALNRKTATGGRLNAYNALNLTGGGPLQVSVDPPDGSALLTASSQPVFVRVSNPFGVINATVTAAVAGVTNLVFRNDGQPPDVMSSNDVYSAVFQVPASTNPLTMTVVTTAPDRVGVTNVIHYDVLPSPTNDFFTNAIKVPVGGAGYRSNNRFATLESGEPRHNGNQTVAASLWWVWTPTSNTNVFIDATGSRVDTELTVYTGNQVASLVSVVRTNSNLAQHRSAHVGFSAQAGTAYRIVLASSSPAALGTIQLRVAPGGQPDTTPPTIFVSNPLSGVTVFDSLIYVAGTALDPAPNVSGVKEVLVSLNGGIASSASGTTNWTAPVLLKPGLNTIQVNALDEAGNAASVVTVQVNYLVLGPANDLFANATALTGNAGSVDAYSTNATKEFGEPHHAGNFGGKSLWWMYQPPADGVLTLGTTNSSFDTLLAVYTGGTVSTLTAIAGNDDAYDGNPGGFSSLVQAVRSNQTYRIAVDGYDGVSGHVQLQHSFTPATVYRLTVNPTVGGVVLPPTGDYAGNSTVLVSAVPDEFFAFAGWTGSFTGSTNPLSVLVNSNVNLTASFQPMVFTDDFETGNTAKIGWACSGSLPWIVQTNNVRAGQFAAQSGAIVDSQTSSLELTTNFNAGLGSFYFKVSSESGWDFLEFYVDGSLQQDWSGEMDWTSYVFPLAAGSHTLEWRYAKDASRSAGLDAAFIDNVNLPLNIPPTTPASLQVFRQPDGSLQFQILGQVNQTYVIQGTTNLASPVVWQDLSTNVASGGVINYSITATNRSLFFRAKVP